MHVQWHCVYTPVGVTTVLVYEGKQFKPSSTINLICREDSRHIITHTHMYTYMQGPTVSHTGHVVLFWLLPNPLIVSH